MEVATIYVKAKTIRTEGSARTKKHLKKIASVAAKMNANYRYHAMQTGAVPLLDICQILPLAMKYPLVCVKVGDASVIQL